MKNNTNQGDLVPGTLSPIPSGGKIPPEELDSNVRRSVPDHDKRPMPELSQVKQWVLNDVERCLALLNAIKSDPDLTIMVARWFHGRIGNHFNKPDPSQIHMFDGKSSA